MNHKIFIRACELLKASGSSFEELIYPFWSEVQDGVVLPTLGKVIPRLEPRRYRCSWYEAMADATAAELILPSKEELQYMQSHLDQINRLLRAHNGSLLRNKDYWSLTEYSEGSALNVYFGSGSTDIDSKSVYLYIRPLATFKKTLTYSRSCQR